MKILVIVMIMLMISVQSCDCLCGSDGLTPAEIQKIERQNNPELDALLESYYITLENPENNQPGEQDSIINAIRNFKYR